MGTRNNSIERSSVAAMMAFAFTRRAMFRSAVRFVRSVAVCFFLPQYQAVLNPRRRPVVCVDDPLDRRIPFRPEHIKTYLSFVHLWIKACRFLHCTFGARAVPHIREFVDGVTRLYHNAFRVYDSCQSTTTRPPVAGNVHMRFVRAVDPHVHCVPSLHVMIVVYTWVRMRTIIDRLTESGRAVFAGEIAYLRRQALAITESVLYVKQHSVNCVPAALFALHDLVEEFSLEIGDQFVEELFAPGGSSPVAPRDRERIAHHMKSVHRRFLAERRRGHSPVEVILNFLRTQGQAADTVFPPQGLPLPESPIPPAAS